MVALGRGEGAVVASRTTVKSRTTAPASFVEGDCRWDYIPLIQSETVIAAAVNGGKGSLGGTRVREP